MKSIHVISQAGAGVLLMRGGVVVDGQRAPVAHGGPHGRSGLTFHGRRLVDRGDVVSVAGGSRLPPRSWRSRCAPPPDRPCPACRRARAAPPAGRSPPARSAAAGGPSRRRTSPRWCHRRTRSRSGRPGRSRAGRTSTAGRGPRQLLDAKRRAQRRPAARVTRGLAWKYGTMLSSRTSRVDTGSSDLALPACARSRSSTSSRSDAGSSTTASAP